MKNLVHKITTAISVLCFFCSIDVVSGSVNTFEVSSNEIKYFYFNDTENTNYTYIEKWYEVSSDHDVTINLVDYIDTIIISCKSSENINYLNQHGTIINIPKKNIKAGTWFCTLWKDNESKNEEIYFRLRTNDTMPPQQILVNHIDLDLKKANDIYTAEYFYQDGETVNVDCISSNETCTVQMINPFSVIDDNYNTSAWGFGFPAKLNSKYNRRKIKCISDCSGIKSTVEVTFVLQEEPNKNTQEITVKINNQDITRNKNVALTYEDAYVNYAYFYNQKAITITCDTNINNTAIDIFCKNCDLKEDIKKVLEGKRIEVTLVPNMITSFSCEAKQGGKNVVQEFKFRFQLVSCRDDSQLTVQGLIQENILSEYHAYEYRQGISYINYTYEYENSYLLDLDCVKDYQNQFVSFNKSDYIEDNNKPVLCLLCDRDNKIIARIWILFRLKSQSTMRPSTEIKNVPTVLSTEAPHTTTTVLITDHGDHHNQENNNSCDDHNSKVEPNQYELYIPAVVVPMLIIIVCVVIVRSKMKIRNRLNRREPEQTYDYCVVNAITPHYPAQSEIEYAVPEGDMQENTLYHRTKDYYSKVIPKSQRQRNKQQSINTATNRSKEFEEDARLDFLVMNSLYSSTCLEPNDRSEPTKSVSDNQGTSRKASTNLEMLSDVYSEPINRKETQDDTYTNVTGEPHYSNKMGGYCVYPTYSEPHIKK